MFFLKVKRGQISTFDNCFWILFTVRCRRYPSSFNSYPHCGPSGKTFTSFASIWWDKINGCHFHGLPQVHTNLHGFRLAMLPGVRKSIEQLREFHAYSVKFTQNTGWHLQIWAISRGFAFHIDWRG